MARQPEIQYIRLYTQGSAARQLEMAPPDRKKPRTRLPKPRREKQMVIRLDPIALCGIVVAAVMLVLMVVGSLRLYRIQQETARMEKYVAALQLENQVLEYTYESGFDLEEIREIALSMGMIPKEDVPQITIRVPEG